MLGSPGQVCSIHLFKWNWICWGAQVKFACPCSWAPTPPSSRPPPATSWPSTPATWAWLRSPSLPLFNPVFLHSGKQALNFSFFRRALWYSVQGATTMWKTTTTTIITAVPTTVTMTGTKTQEAIMITFGSNWQHLRTCKLFICFVHVTIV